jgi:hypothetical protein
MIPEMDDKGPDAVPVQPRSSWREETISPHHAQLWGSGPRNLRDIARQRLEELIKPAGPNEVSWSTWALTACSLGNLLGLTQPYLSLSTRVRSRLAIRREGRQ